MCAAEALSSLLQDTQPASEEPSPEFTVFPSQVWRAGEMSLALRPDNVVRSGFDALDAELPGAGWPRGQLIELLMDRAGTGELSLLTPALLQATREHQSCVWILPRSASGPATSTQEVLPYAPALQAAGINLARHIFVRPGTAREAFWAVEQSLRAAHLGALICWLPPSRSADTEFRALRRLHLLASHTRTLLFALRGTQCVGAPSPAVLRLQLEQRDGSLQVQLLKRRGRPLLEPLTLQVHPAHWKTARVSSHTRPAVATPVVQAPRVPANRPTPQRWSWQSLFAH